MTKAEIRKEMLIKRDSLNPVQVGFLGNTILDNLTATDEYNDAKLIFAYASYRNEADTMGLIDRALNDGKKIALPCSYMSNGEPKMDFYYINSLTDLVTGYKGILEPDRRKMSIQKAEQAPDIFIIPGVAFDSNMNRIGYGKGFYDKYLGLHNISVKSSSETYIESSHHPFLIGLCYSFQTAYEIPADANDVKMDMLITENGVIRGKHK